MSEQEKQALVTSLRLLAATPKSRRTLQKKLEERGYQQDIVEKTLSHLEKQGLMNDRAYAQSIFQILSSQKPSGRRRIAFELEKRGIGNAMIQDVLQGYTVEQERALALDLARQKQGRWKKFDEVRRKKKTYDFLVRRGFDFALSRDVVNEIEA